MNTRAVFVLLVTAGSVLTLLGAFWFQYVARLAPCPICIWQRWPHVVAIVLGLAAWRWRAALLPWLGGLTMALSSGIALYHTGIERKWWPGPSSCTGGGSLDTSNLLNFDAAPTLVMCDNVPWQMFGLSMASYNGLLSVMLCALWVLLARGVSAK